MFLPLGHAELPCAPGKIFSIAMPQILDAHVFLASMMQRYGFFSKYARKYPIILTFNFDLRSSLLTLGIADASIVLLSLNRSLQFSICIEVIQVITYSLWTSIFWEKLEREILYYI